MRFTNSVSSKRFLEDSVSLFKRSLSNYCKSFLLSLTSFNKVVKDSSRAFCSLESTIPNNYYSRPP